jgi:hypothetical protein
MFMRTIRLSLMVLAGLVLTGDRAWGSEGIRFLRQTTQEQEELKLKYDVTVLDHGTGRVTVVLTIADEGRLKPLDSIDLMIPMEKGSGWVDLEVSLATSEKDGKRAARIHLRKDWAERAQIWLKASTFDGKKGMERENFAIPISQYLKNAAAAAPAAKPEPAPAPAPQPAAPAAPATEQKKD